MTSQENHSHISRRFYAFATFVLAVAVLRVAQAVFMPIALSVLFAFFLTPLVVRLMRARMPRTLAITTAVTLGLAIVGSVGWFVTAQALSLAEQLPNYEQNIHRKIEAIKQPTVPGSLARTSGMVEKLRDEIQAPDANQPETKKRLSHPEQEVVPVEVRAPKTTAFSVAKQVMGPILAPLGVAGIVIVLVVMILFQREDLRDRFIQVVSAGNLNIGAQAVDDAAQRVSRYLLMQLVVNITYGVPVGVALYFIGIPNALLWGVLATLLRFIPFLGPWLAASFPLALAVAVDPGWTKLIYTGAVFIVMELISNNIIEVNLYSASTGVSNLALLVAAVFWTWLWGPVGLFLSTPLTVCLMVLGRHVPGLKFLSVLLGSDRVLEPPAQFYQRMLAMESEEMFDLAEKFVEERSLAGFYDDVFVPALLMSEEDRHRGTLAEVRQKFIFEASRELIEELERRGPERAERKSSDTAASAAPVLPRKRLVGHIVGMPARDDADEIVALMLGHLLRERGFTTELLTTKHSKDDCITALQRTEGAAFISALPPSALTSARKMCQAVQDECPDVPLVVGIWSREANPVELKERLRGRPSAAIATRLSDAVGHLEATFATQSSGARRTRAPFAATPAQSNIEALGFADAPPEEWFDMLTRDLALAFDVPVSLVMIVDEDQAFWTSQLGMSGAHDEERERKWDATISSHAAASGEVVIVENVAKDRRLAANPFLLERGIRFYIGVPLRTRSGQAVGTLCIIDTKPRQVTDHEKALLQQRTLELMDAVETKLKAEKV